MKFSCLSEGKGYYFPPCHILDLCEFRILFDCPMDLSDLSIFYPVLSDLVNLQNEQTNACASCNFSHWESLINGGQKTEKPLDRSSLICAVPWYKVVKNLKLWDASSFDVILISSPMGMLGLPFLTRSKGFSAKVYATEATMKLAQLMMEDLVIMHMEFRQFYGPEDPSAPVWMKWDEIESLPSSLRETLSGDDGRELCGWMPLYSAADVNYCLQKVQSLKYGEVVCYNGTLIIQAFSSGLDIGTCNWRIVSPKQSVSYISTSSFAQATSQGFDYNALKGSDVVLFSDSTAFGFVDEHNKNMDTCFVDKDVLDLSVNDDKISAEVFLNSDDISEESEKLDFLCTCSLESIRAGGSVLIPIGRFGIVLKLLEKIASLLKSLDMKVPIYVLSSFAEELFAFLNVIPEWLCEERKDRLYSGQPLFDHLELLKEKRLFLFPAIHSPEFLGNTREMYDWISHETNMCACRRTWQEPCVIFCPHWSLRLGPSVHLLQRWSGDELSLLMMEDGVDTNIAFLPFKSMAIKVLQCSFLSGMTMRKAETLLRILKPKYAVFPQKTKRPDIYNQPIQLLYYSEGKTIEVSNLKDSAALDIDLHLGCRFNYTKMLEHDLSFMRVKGELFMEEGKSRLLNSTNQVLSLQARPLQYVGQIDLKMFLTVLQEKGMSVKVEEIMDGDGFEKVNIVHVLDPYEALIEVREGRSLITTADEMIASQISQVLSNMLDAF